MTREISGTGTGVRVSVRTSSLGCLLSEAFGAEGLGIPSPLLGCHLWHVLRWLCWYRCTSRYVPFWRRLAWDVPHHGRYGPEGQYSSCALLPFGSGMWKSVLLVFLYLALYFLRLWQALLPCFMAGMDHKDSFARDRCSPLCATTFLLVHFHVAITGAALGQGCRARCVQRQCPGPDSQFYVVSTGAALGQGCRARCVPRQIPWSRLSWRCILGQGCRALCVQRQCPGPDFMVIPPVAVLGKGCRARCVQRQCPFPDFHGDSTGAALGQGFRARGATTDSAELH